MGWTLSGYNAVISAEQHRDTVRLELDRAKQDGNPTQRLEADLTSAEDNLRRAKDAISGIAPGLIRGTAFLGDKR